MILLGTIRGTTYSGELLVQLEHMPHMNQRVHDNRKNEIGKVVYIFGNVRSPYAIVRPFYRQNMLQMVGRATYVR